MIYVILLMPDFVELWVYEKDGLPGVWGAIYNVFLLQ